MRTKIFLENNELDLSDDIDMSFTYNIDDVKDFGARDTSFSKTIRVPGNAVNNLIFGNIFAPGSSNDYNAAQDNVGYNFNAAVSARCVAMVDNIQIFKGVARLTEIIDTAGKKEYELNVSGELGGFMFQLGNARLEDIDFSEYNLLYSYSNILASWNTIAGSGVYFPLIDYGNVSTNKKDFQYTAFRPALYVREYLEKIINTTDYTVASNFFLSALFDRLGIGHNQKTLVNNTSAVLNLLKTTTQSMDFLTAHSSFVEWDSAIGGLFAFAAGNSQIQYIGTDPITLTLTVTLLGSYDLTGTGFAISTTKNTALIPGTDQNYAAGADAFSYTKTMTVSLVTNDILKFKFFRGTPPAGSEFVNLETGDASAISSTPSQSPIHIGDMIDINSSIPKGIFQRDFVIWLLKMFNLYVYESAFDSNKLYIEPFVDFYASSSANALNWSGKIDRSQPIRSIPMSQQNARFYQFKFKEDNDFYGENYRKSFNQGYGDFIYDTEFDNSKDTDIIELGFAQSVLYQNVGTDKVYPAIYKLSGTTEQPMDHVLRLLQFKKMACDVYDILDDVSVLGSPTVYGYGGHIDDPVTPTNDIGFGIPKQLQFTPTGPYPDTNVFDTFHASYLVEITNKDSKMIICRAYLTQVDILQLDFSKLIYVDGVLFRLNKITDYNPIALNTTEIQLLKAINL